MLWALSDLHLPGGSGKTMDRFGGGWVGHAARIEAAWRECVGTDDTVLVPGDVSWAMKPADAAADLAILASLPGRKFITRGNHDYWWKSVTQANQIMPPGITAVLNSSVDAGDFILCAARGWELPSSEHFTEERDGPILAKEIERLRATVGGAGPAAGGRPVVAMMHFPPTDDGSPTAFTRILSGGGVSVCVFGHVHGDPGAIERDFMLEGVRYILCSADQAGFRPVRIPLDGSMPEGSPS